MTAAAMEDRVLGPTETCMLYIWGDLTKLSKEDLELYLEDEADADIDKVIYGINKDVALLQFKTKPDYVKLEKMLKEKPIEGVMLSVSEVPLSATLHVHSKSKLEPFYLQLYFENKHESDGGGKVKIEQISPCVCLAQFETPAIAEAVLQRKSHRLDEDELLVSIYRAELSVDRDLKRENVTGARMCVPTEPCMVYIWGELANISKDKLKQCLETEADANVDKVIYGPNEEVALIQFLKKPDYEKLEKKLTRNPVEGVMLRVSEVPLSATVQVHSISHLKPYYLRLYFGNKDQSGGSGKVEIEQVNSSVCLAHFENSAIAEAVLKKSHKLDKDELQVSIYRAELGLIIPGYDTSQSCIEKHIYTIVCNLDPVKVTYIKSTKEVNAYLQEFHAEIMLTHPAKDEVKVICKMTPDTDNCKIEPETWTNMVVDAITEHSNVIEVEKIVCLPKYWKIICEHVAVYKKEREKAMNLVMIIENPENHELLIIGPEESIANSVEDIKKICQDVQESQEQVKVEIEASAAKLKVLKKMRLKEQFSKIKIQIDSENKNLLIQGSEKDLKTAMKEVNTILNGITEVEVVISDLVINIVSSIEGSEYVTDMLNNKSLDTVIECDKNKLIITGPVDQCKKTEDLIRKEIIRFNIKIHEENRSALQGNEWVAFVQEHKSLHQGKLILQVAQDFSTLKVAMTSDLKDAIIEEITKYFKTGNYIKQLVPVHEGCLKLLKEHAQDKIKEIENDFQWVKIQPNDDGKIGFNIEGISDSVIPAAARMKDLISTAIHQNKDITEPGLYKFLNQSLVSIIGIENKYSVALKVMGRAKEQESQRSLEAARCQQQSQIIGSVLTEQGVTIKIVMGDLTELRVDAIVNPANHTLKHYGGLAAALADKGGQSIQEESDVYIRDNGLLPVGNAIMTKAGALNCKRIIHTVAPYWAGGAKREENLLWDCVYNSLKLAEKEAMRSIAFPVIGSGIFDVPIEVSTECIVTAILYYLHTTDGKDITISEIYLVDKDETEAEEFIKALKRKDRIKSSQDDDTGARPKEKADDTKSLSSLDTYVTPSGVTIKTVKGEIAKQKTDGIMNSIPGNMNLSSGALSYSIMQSMNAANRQAVQAEAKQKAPNGLQAGDVITTSAGNLASKIIFHIVLPNWKNDPTTQQYLEKALGKILEKAHKNSMTSLALPAVGTGNLHWPNDIVAKTMFDAIIKFSQKHPKSSLTAVNLVIYPTDHYSLTAFENYMQTIGAQGATGTGAKDKPSFSTQPGWHSHEAVERPVRPSGDGPHGEPSNTPNRGEMQIRGLKLQVTTGDITLETTDAIVNSTNSAIDLSKGGVSQALARAGGQDFVDKCRNHGRTKNGLAVTGPGNLQVKFVIHLDISYFDANWKKMILKCLQRAEKLKLSSVSFPALGTGVQSKSPEDMATYMMEAISDFTKTKPQHLNLVRIVIYQSHMVSAYFDQMEAASKPATSLWSAFKQIMGPADGKLQKISNPTYYTEDTNVSSEMCITLSVYGFSEDSISQALDAIDKLWQDHRADRTLGGSDEPDLQEIITKLSPEETKKIEKIGESNKSLRVLVESKSNVARIRIHGFTKDVMHVEIAVRKYLHEMEKKEALLLCRFVQWEFEDVVGVFTPYPEDINVKIEKAFSQKKATVRWEEEVKGGGQNTMEINFRNMTKTTLQTRCFQKVKRREISKKDGPPENWAPMQPTERFIRVLLRPTDKEYTDVLTAFNKTASKHTILKIERVQNPRLYRQYTLHKLDMQEERPNIQAEHMLWHGTTDDILENINCNGFNRSYCGINGYVYGQGVYFAWKASYSAGYAVSNENGQRHMYYASVLTGEYAKGIHTMKEPPAKNPSQPHVRYDSTVNDPANPSIFVVYFDSQVYPKYLITFT